MVLNFSLFRGILAPASLKPVLMQDGPRQRDHLFRGILAPASLKLLRHLQVGTSFDLFRGILAPASLKPPPRPATIRCGARPLPGHPRPGLIEACVPTARVRRRSLPPLPGHPRPGLIEAFGATGSTRVPPRRRLFRGILAPASLKQLRRRLGSGLRPSALPGHPRPGLIEARARRASRATIHRHSSGASSPRPH